MIWNFEHFLLILEIFCCFVLFLSTYPRGNSHDKFEKTSLQLTKRLCKALYFDFNSFFKSCQMLKSCSVFFVKIMIPLMTMQMCISSLVLPLESSFNASTLTRTVHLELQFKSGVNFINMLMLAQLKVHRSKGMALTIVYVQPPKIS